MKKFIFILFTFLNGVLFASNKFVKIGGSDAATGLSDATAWQSISKVNASTLVYGDTVFFNCGDNFPGTLAPTVSGVTFSSYGTGAKPIITGLATISSWTSLGGNIWEATVPGGLSTLNMVVLNSKLTAMGRYPNDDAANGGYLTYESFVNNTSITDNQLTGSPNWAGGEVVIRQSDFVIKRLAITSHSGSIISFTGTTGLNANYGYFIQNDSLTLDKNGEWYFSPNTHKIKMYYTSTPPSIEVSTLTNLVTMMFSSGTRKSKVSFNGLSFRGSEGVILNIQYCDSIRVDNCDFSYAGVDAIDHRNMNYLTIQNSSFLILT